jgi:biopolymer transport protein ExbD
MATATDTDREHVVDIVDEPALVPHRPIEDAEMDITPMIDITFLLLIFFLVAARLDEDTPVELPPARHGTAVAIKSSVIITLAESDGEHAEVYQGDGKASDRMFPSGNLTAQEEAIVSYVERGLSEGKSSVLIKAEKGVKHRDVARVSTAVGKAGSGDLYVAVLEVQ